MENKIQNLGRWFNASQIKATKPFDLTEFKGATAAAASSVSLLSHMACNTILLLKKDDPVKYIYQTYFSPRVTFDEFKNKNELLADLLIQQEILKFSGVERLEIPDLVNWFDEIKEKYSININKIGFDTAYKNTYAEEFENHGYKILQVKHDYKMTRLFTFMFGGELRTNCINYNNNLLLTLCLLNVDLLYEDGKGGSYAFTNPKIPMNGITSLATAYHLYANYRNYFYSHAAEKEVSE